MTHIIKCLIVDDEPVAVRVLMSYVQKLPQIELLGTCESALEAQSFLNQQSVDLLLIDINMPYMSGLEFVKTLFHPPKVIFTTAYREFGPEAYELNAVDYLLKPISFPRFMTAINKLEKVSNQEISNSNIIDKSIWIEFDKQKIRVSVRDILYLESRNDHVIIHTLNSSQKYYNSLSEMEYRLKPYNFLRIHRSFLINTDQIKRYSLNEIEMDGAFLPIGRSYKESVIAKLKN